MPTTRCCADTHPSVVRRKAPTQLLTIELHQERIAHAQTRDPPLIVAIHPSAFDKAAQTLDTARMRLNTRFRVTHHVATTQHEAPIARLEKQTFHDRLVNRLTSNTIQMPARCDDVAHCFFSMSDVPNEMRRGDVAGHLRIERSTEPRRAKPSFTPRRSHRFRHDELGIFLEVSTQRRSGNFRVFRAIDQAQNLFEKHRPFEPPMTKKLGIERRLLTAGENKGFLDPFSPQNPNQTAHAQVMLDDIHQQFIDVVKTGRGARLKETPEMFSGLMWTGDQSVKLGLADDFGSVDSVARDVIKAEKVLDYSVRDNIAERFARRLGAGAVNSLWKGFFETSAGVSLR